MEENMIDKEFSLYSEEEFANHITINLFKKKNNSKLNQINVGIGPKRANTSCRNDFSKAIQTSQMQLRRKSSESSQFSEDEKFSNSTTQNSSDINQMHDINSHTLLDLKSCDSTLKPSTHKMKLSNKTTNIKKPSLPVQTSASPNPFTVNTSTTQLQKTQKAGPQSPEKSNSGSDDLTPLSWLQSLDMGGVVPHLAAPPTPPASPISSQNSTGTDGAYSEASLEKIDYSVDGSVKPPYSYAALIGMAMKENDNKMTLSAIYKWIKEHFVFYKTADQSWQNSIRHNLSLNKCFLKVARSKDEPGKGGFWKLDPEYADSLVDGVFKKRRPSRGTAPPATKSRRKRPFPYSQQIQQQVQKQREKEQEEMLRQKEQEEAVRSLLHPVQAAYMPPPKDKPPTLSPVYMDQQEPVEQATYLADESVNPLKEDFVWSTILGEENGQEDCWQLRSQEVVTDLTQSGDPSTYQITMSPNFTANSLPSSMNSIINTYNPQIQHQDIIHHPQQQLHHHSQTLPSFELSPESLGVEEDLFGSPEYSETSNDDRDSLISSLDLGVGLDLAVSTSTWDSKAPSNVYNITGNNLMKDYSRTLELSENGEGMLMNIDGSQDLIELHDFEGNLTQLTTLEPVAPVVVQHVNSQNWNQDQTWEEAKTFSLLEANLDFDKLINLDVI